MRGLEKMILSVIKRILSWIKDHTIGVILAAIGAFVALFTKGAVDNHKANKINRKAIDIEKESLEKYEREHLKTQQALAELGQVEKTVIDSFGHFSDLIEQIQGRPKMERHSHSGVKLPKYDLKEMKQLSNNVQIIIAGVGGAGFGALAGLAAFGAAAVVAAPALVGSGFVLCVKGANLKKKAINNKKQAEHMRESVNEIVSFYGDLREASKTFKDSMAAVYQRYDEGLQRLEHKLTVNTVWRKFSRYEKEDVENTVLLARLLYSMVQTEIVVRQKKEDQLEIVNSAELEIIEQQASKLLNALV